MRTKNLGLAIILTLFFGPFGLFYASITGGLIMLLIPVALSLLFILGITTNSLFLFTGSIILLPFLLGSGYWITCIIWAIISVNNHNNKVNEYFRQIKFTEKGHEIESEFTPKQSTNQINPIETSSNSENPTLQEWCRMNPHKSINDYYMKFGLPKSYMSTNERGDYNDDTKNKSNRVKYYGIGIVSILIVILFFIAYDKEKNKIDFSSIKYPFGINKEQKNIENLIENVYFGLVNGVYANIDGTSPKDFPFYNSDVTTFGMMAFMPMATFTGNFNLEPKNIVVHKISGNSADVSYDLIVTSGKNIVNEEIQMSLKKNWR